MGIPILIGLLFGSAAFFSARYFYETRRSNANTNTNIKWAFGLWFMIFGLIAGLVVSHYTGEKIAKRCLEKNQVVITKTINLVPFCPWSDGVYIATSKKYYELYLVNPYRNVIYFLEQHKQSIEFVEREWDQTKKEIVFSDSGGFIQEIRPDVGVFWRWFVGKIPTKSQIVIPEGGLQEGSVVTTYTFVPLDPK